MRIAHHFHAIPDKAEQQLSDRSPLRVNLFEVRHEAEHVDEYVVVGFKQEFRILAVLRHPLQTHYALIRQVSVRVDKVFLNYVAVCIGLQR